MTVPRTDDVSEAARRARAAWRRERAAGASTEWPVFGPPLALASGPLGVAQAADREIARQTAVRARAVAAFAGTRPSSVDRPQGQRGAMSAERWAARPEVIRRVSEWATPELMVAFSLTDKAAEALLVQSLTLVGRLPGTLAALESGALHPGHLWCLLEHVAPIEDDRVRAEVEAGLLRWAAGRVKSPAQLAARARREVDKRDARAAVRKLARAIRQRGMFLQPGPADGMACLGVVCTLPEAQALYRTLHALADTLENDPGQPDQPDQPDPRTRGQKLVDVLLDLVLRPGECEPPPVRVLLTVVAAMGTLLGGDTPGEIDGHTVPAQMIRHLLATLTGHQPADTPPADVAPAEPADPAAPTGPVPDEAPAAAEPAGAGAFADAPARWWAGGEAWFGAELPPDPDPEPVPEEVLLALWNAENPDLIDAGDLLAPEDLLDPAGWADLERWFDDGTAPDPADPADPAPPAPPGSGWWAAADRAVADAGAAVRAATEALGHATRAVDTARLADLADEAAWQQSDAGRVDAAQTALEALAAAGASHRHWLADLLTATGGGGLAERPRIALTDALSGTLLALTDLPGLRSAAHCGRPACRRRPEACGHDLTGRPGLGPPPPTDGYRPAADLDRFVRARDRRCRFPGCRRRVPKGGELDHNRRWPDGPTSAANLTGFCTTNHDPVGEFSG